MKKKNGFTLVELLAVIVILAIILVIAVPQIMNTIDSAREGSFKSSAQMIASSAEREYTVRQTLGTLGTNPITNANCSDFAKITDTDYATCTVTVNNSGVAIVKIAGQGKFAGKWICDGSTNGATISSAACPAS